MGFKERQVHRDSRSGRSLSNAPGYPKKSRGKAESARSLDFDSCRASHGPPVFSLFARAIHPPNHMPTSALWLCTLAMARFAAFSSRVSLFSRRSASVHFRSRFSFTPSSASLLADLTQRSDTSSRTFRVRCGGLKARQIYDSV